MLGDIAIKQLIGQLTATLKIKDPAERVRALGTLTDNTDAASVSAQAQLHRARLLAVAATQQANPESLSKLGDRIGLSKPQTARLVTAARLLLANDAEHGWTPPPAKAPVGKPKRPTINHNACEHERTPKARAVCRADKDSADRVAVKAAVLAMVGLG